MKNGIEEQFLILQKKIGFTVKSNFQLLFLCFFFSQFISHYSFHAEDGHAVNDQSFCDFG
jgi:hypothetical protein